MGKFKIKVFEANTENRYIINEKGERVPMVKVINVKELQKRFKKWLNGNKYEFLQILIYKADRIEVLYKAIFPEKT